MKRKSLTKVLSIILATLFVIEILPFTVFAAELETYNHALEVQTETTDVVESPIAFEVTEEREENIKVYQREDGTFSAFTSAVPIHYEENGEWKDIDNTLIEKEVDNKTVLINKDNSYQVEFPEQLTSDAEIKLDNGEAEIAFSMRNISASSAVVADTPLTSETSELAELVDINNKDSAVTFSNIRLNVDVEYTVGALTQVSQLVSGLTNGTTMTANYTYSDDRITSISHLGTTYNFEYDDYGNQTCVKVGEQPLVSYSYNTKKTDINKITYGNGFIINYVLDTDGNITKIKYDGADTYTYKYSDGVLTEVYDYMSMLKTVYADDGSTTIYPFTVTDSVVTLGDAVYSSATDDDGNSVETVHGTPYTYSSSNEEYIPQTDNVKSTESVSYGNNDKVEVSSSVDFFGRTTNKTVTYYQNGTAKMPVETTYGYNISNGVTLDGEIYQRSVNRIDSVLFNYGEDSYHFSYKYDTRGNIIKMYENDILRGEFEYDEAGQLKACYDLCSGQTFVYSYDVNGNLISKTEYENVTNKDISTGTVVSSDTYSYTDASWSDKLTAFNGQSISYDLMGNPLSYRGATLTWNGRLLMSYEKDGTKYAYTYNADNLRTSKSKYVNNTLVSQETYIWSGDVLIATKKYDCATATSDVIRYLYDSNGESHGFTYNGNTYLYVKNLQGDVIAIISAGDELLCLGLNYDPWGKVAYMTDEEADVYELQVAQEIAAINIIAYRGYFYDSETGLYYLQSRYYDPEVGRFINADDTSFIGYDGTPISVNIFAYCENNQINYADPNGFYSCKAAFNYAKKWWNSFNTSQYKANNNDCANFVSQCLYAGGLTKMTGVGLFGWHHYKLLNGWKFQISDAWGIAKELHKWLCDTFRFNTITFINSNNKIYRSLTPSLKKEQCRYVIFFMRCDVNYYGHAAISGKVEKGDVYYYGHTNPANGEDSKYSILKRLNQKVTAKDCERSKINKKYIGKKYYKKIKFLEIR